MQLTVEQAKKILAGAPAGSVYYREACRTLERFKRFEGEGSVSVSAGVGAEGGESGVSSVATAGSGLKEKRIAQGGL